MSQTVEPRQSIPIAPDFFCDGHYYVLTSSSLGGSGLEPSAIADALGYGNEAAITEFLQQGICIPVCFDGDCALDGETLFALGDLTEQEENDWIGRLAGQLNIPCGKLVILCGGGDAEELAYAISGQPPKPHYRIFQVIDVPPGAYLVEIYAYLSSMTVQQSLEEYDENWNCYENEPLKQWYQLNRPGTTGTSYIIRLSPLTTAPPLPERVPDIGWCGEFEFRKPEL
ncbi:MAG: hypothetical protein ACTS2F_20655 [Thainema sp.]